MSGCSQRQTALASRIFRARRRGRTGISAVCFLAGSHSRSRRQNDVHDKIPQLLAVVVGHVFLKKARVEIVDVRADIVHRAALLPERLVCFLAGSHSRSRQGSRRFSNRTGTFRRRYFHKFGSPHSPDRQNIKYGFPVPACMARRWYQDPQMPRGSKELYTKVIALIDSQKIKPVKASGKNGKSPALYKTDLWLILYDIPDANHL